MALEDIRISWRVHLSDAARGVDADAHLVTLRHHEETLERLYLRLVAWGLWFTPTLRFGPGMGEPDAPALFDEDLTGRRTIWIAVNPPDAEYLAHAVRHNRGAVVGAAFEGEAALSAFRANSRTLRGIETGQLAVVDPALLASLAETLTDRRYDVDLTLVEDTIYLSAGGHGFDGHVERLTGGDLPRRA